MRSKSGKNADLFHFIDDLLQHQEDFLGDELNSLFDAETVRASTSPVAAQTAPGASSMWTARRQGGGVACADDDDDIAAWGARGVSELGVQVQARAPVGGGPSPQERRKSAISSLFADDDNEESSPISTSTPNSLLSMSSSNSRSRFSLSAYKKASPNSVFDSNSMRDIFHELADEGTPALLDNTVNDSGFLDGGGFDARAIMELESLIGNGRGSAAGYAPGMSSISEEGLQSSFAAHVITEKKKVQDADDVAAALLGDLEDEAPSSPDGSTFITVSSPQKKPCDAGVSGTKKKMNPALTEMDYEEFMHRLRIPQCNDLRGVISKFILSILGPSGNGNPPNAFQDMPKDSVFYGTKDIEKRCGVFFEAMDAHMRKHPRWMHEPDEKFSSIRDCLERHCMLSLADIAYRAVKSDESQTDDMLTFHKIRCLQFLKPEALDINPALHNEKIWAIAGAELAKINEPACVTPGAKNACVVSCAAVIFRALSLASTKLTNGKEDGSTCGADDFLPLFIWVVLRAQVPNLFANCDFIEAYLNPVRLMGKDGYCLMNLRSALMFIRDLTAEGVTMDAAAFETSYAAAQEELGDL